MAQPGRSKKLFKLRKFDVKGMKPDSVVVAIGKRQTGKTNLITDLLFHHRSFPFGTIVSKHDIRHYCTFVPKSCIHDNLNPAIIANVIEHQSLIRKQRDKEVAETGATSINDAQFPCSG